VFGIWSGTSFEATLLRIARSQARWLLLAVMLVGLFTNATAPLWIVGAISDAKSRLLCWSGAAAIDLAGTWLAIPARPDAPL
jgi:hypothetical protein